ncbi:MAG: RNA polymerase sigma factor [Spirochaetales bacterium]|nr:RNA polymerase sigma factor [Spirochaetales bacterium]
MPEKGFDEIYKALNNVIFKVAFRIVGDQDAAMDLCHEAFIKYFERIDPLPDLDQTKYWLIRVVKNLSFNFEKKRLREIKGINKLKENTQPFTASHEEQVIKQEIKSDVQEALLKLPYNLRVVLVLKEYGKMSYKEIGESVGISEGNVKVRVFRAREKLAQLLKEKINYVP